METLEKKKINYFSRLAFLIMFGTGIVYACMIWKGEGSTNLSSWIIWSLVSIASTASYYHGTDKDAEKSLVYFAGTLATLLIAFVALFKGKLDSLVVKDYVAIALTIIALLLWYFTQSSRVAQLVIQAAGLIGFFPLWIAMKEGVVNENPYLWAGWVCAYAISLIGIISIWGKDPKKPNSWIEIMGPLNYFWLHGITLIMIIV